MLSELNRFVHVKHESPHEPEPMFCHEGVPGCEVCRNGSASHFKEGTGFGF